MDKLEAIFTKQKELNDHITEVRGIHNDEWDIDTGIEKHAVALLCELTEVIEETNYKWWKNKKEIDKDKLKEELIDVLHFYVCMCLDVGMTADEVYNIYMGKNKENFDRQDGISHKKGYDINDNEVK